MRANDNDNTEEDVLEITISAAVDRQTAEGLQLEALRLLEQHGLRVRSVMVTRASESVTGTDSAGAT